MLYVVAVIVHVVVAVVGVGLVGAIPLTARFARRSEGDVLASGALLGALLRTVQIGLVLMLLSGVLIDVSVGGNFHRAGWFKVSMTLFVAIGFVVSRAGAALRGGIAPGGVRRDALSKVESWGWVACALVALVTFLMQSKVLS